jgi:Ca-activated chloride channel family protein
MRTATCFCLLVSLVLGCGEVKSAREAARSRRAEAKKVTSTEAATPAADAAAPAEQFNREAYDRIVDNAFVRTQDHPLSTFSIDVDTAAYSNMRRFLNQGQLPPKDAVRIEELINYFTYDYAPPSGDEPFSANVEVGPCPWNAKHQLARIGLKGRVVAADRRGPANLVFLIDVSGSMNQPNKLPLLQSSLKMLVNQMQPTDRIAIVVYAGASGLALPATTCDNAAAITQAIDRLKSGGSTNGGAGIQLAYDTAKQNFQSEGVNRVILCTDGDFNVGITSQGDLTRLIEAKAKEGVFLTVLGFGTGNYQDSTLEKLADKGNGNYAYIDTAHEARKVLVEQVGGTLVTIAKDVKIQVDFNPAHVAGYRLIGYENRLLANEDFHDDTKDAGEIGAGHTVTALYELVPPSAGEELPQVDASKYQSKPAAEGVAGDELLTIKLRYKAPSADESQLSSFPVKASDRTLEQTSADYRFAAAVASFGMLLRESPHRGTSNFNQVLQLATDAKGQDASGYREEFLQLVKTAQALSPSGVAKRE